MSGQGWFRCLREFQGSDRWLSEAFTRGQAWLDLMGLANHAAGWVRIGGRRIDLARGQLCRSKVQLAKRWRWSRGKVNRFFEELEMEQLLKQEDMGVTTRLTVTCYDEWQGADGLTDRLTDTLTVTKRDNRRDTNKNGKKGKKGENPPTPKGEWDELKLALKDFSRLRSEREAKRRRLALVTPTMARIGGWFRRRPSTQWSIYEARALLELGEEVLEEIDLMEGYYLADIERSEDFRRRDPATLLNNWWTELDRARGRDNDVGTEPVNPEADYSEDFDL